MTSTKVTREEVEELINDVMAWGCNCDIMSGWGCGHGQIADQIRYLFEKAGVKN